MKIIIAFLLFVSLISSMAAEEIYLFDDFNYQTTEIINIDSSGSFFSRNIWKRDNKRDTLLKAWFKWNSGDKEFSTNSRVNMTNDGFNLAMHPGYYSNDSLQPMIQSAFQLKSGTYAAICKFSDINDDDKITQAFWLSSPISFIFKTKYARIQYRDEIDFEWNNWWRGSSLQQMSTGCNQRDYKYPSQLDLNCVIQNNKGNSLFLKSSRMPSENKSVLSDLWGLCIFQIDSVQNQTRFAIYFPDDGFGNEIWAGDKNEFGSYYTIYNYSAYHPQLVFFTMGTAQNNVTQLSNFEIDCFFYSSNANMDYKEIKARIDSYKENKIDRIYNGDIFFNEIEDPFNKDNFYFQGAEEIETEEEHLWILQSDCKRWFGHYDIDEMKYRFHNKKGYWEEWNNLWSSNISLTAYAYHDTLELSAKLNEYWSKYEDSAYKKVIIQPLAKQYESIITELKILTQPAKDYSIICYSLSKETELEIVIIDLLGKSVYSSTKFHKSGTYHFELNKANLVTGFYIAIIKSQSDRKYIKFFKR